MKNNKPTTNQKDPLLAPNYQEMSGRFMKMLQEKGGRLKEGEVYVNTLTPLTCICQDGHEFKITPEKLKQNRWCPECSKRVGERICKLVFEHIFGSKFERVRLKDWKSERGAALELDGYSQELKIAFEYQGLQHYKNVGFYFKSEEEFKNRLKNDELKQIFAKRDGITLVIIDEFKRKSDISYLLDLVASECKKAGIQVPKYSYDLDISPAFIGTSNYVKFHRIIQERGLSLPEGKSLGV